MIGNPIGLWSAIRNMPTKTPPFYFFLFFILFYFIFFDCNLCIADDHSYDVNTMQPKTVRATRAILFDNRLRKI